MSLTPLAQALASCDPDHRTEFLANLPPEASEVDVSSLAEAARRGARGDPAGALHAAGAARELAEALNHPRARALAARAWGVGLWASGRMEEALQALRLSGVLAEEAGDPLLAAQAPILAIEVLAQLGRHGEAVELGQDLAARLTALDAGEDAAKVRANLGNVSFQRADYLAALDAWRAAQDEFRRRGQAPAVAQLEVNIANALVHLNRLPEALDRYDSARRELEQLGNETVVAGIEGNVGYLRHIAGHYTESLTAYAGARDRFSRLDLDRDLALCDMGTASVYFDLNLLPEARALYAGCLPVFHRLRLAADTAAAEAGLAAVLEAQGELGAATRALARAGKLYRRDANRTGQARIILRRGEFRLRAGDATGAARDGRAAARIFTAGGLHAPSLQARLLVERADVARGRGSTPRLLRLQREAIAAALPTLEWRVTAEVARSYAASGRNVQALRHYRSAADQLETLRGRLTGEEFRRSFLRDKTALFEEYLALLLDRGTSRSLREAFSLAERARSRTLVERLAGEMEAVADADPLRASLLVQLQALRTQLTWEYSRREGDQDSAARFPLIAATQPEGIRRLEEDYLSVERRLQLHVGEVAGEGTVSLRELREWLSPGEALVEYVATRDEVLAFVVTGREFRTVRGLASRAELDALVGRLRYQWERFQFQNRRRSEGLDAVQHLLRELYDLLLAPLEPLLSGPRVTLIPHGILHGVPFHALHDGEQYALDRWEFAYAPSASVYRLCRRRGDGGDLPSLIFGVSDDSITQVSEEVHTLERLLPDAEIRMNARATRASFPESGRYRFLHLATHAVFRQDNPLFSALRLSDGWLIAHDLYRRRLDCSLATLSACGTGMSGVTADDELLGLVRGFLHAGARAVMVSLWSADDRATADLMERCYGAMVAGKGRAESLREAQLAVRAHRPHPYYWAPFVVVGAR